MGWYYTHGATRKDVIAELTPAEVSGPEGLFRTLRHCCRGNTLYALHETVKTDGSSTKWLSVYLLQHSNSGWGYKPIEESMGPYHYDCPLSYLDEATAPVSEIAADWREKVRLFAAQKAKQNAKRPAVGEVWSCKGETCKRIRIAKVEGRRIEAFNLTGGGYYRIPKKLLGERMAEVGGPQT